jgi:hypothetical protein
LTDFELVELLRSDTVTDEALIVAQEELHRRSLTTDDFDEISNNATNTKIALYKEIGTPKPPNIKTGFILVALLFVGTVTHLIVYDNEKVRFSIFTIPFSLACFSYYIYIIRRLHVIMNIIALERYPVSSAKAVGFHFIPFFNLYWLFKWPIVLGNFIGRNSNIKMIPGFAIGCGLLFSFLCIKAIDSSIGYFMLFSLMAYITTRVNRFIENKEIGSLGTSAI